MATHPSLISLNRFRKCLALPRFHYLLANYICPLLCVVILMHHLLIYGILLCCTWGTHYHSLITVNVLKIVIYCVLLSLGKQHLIPSLCATWVFQTVRYVLFSTQAN